MIDYLIYLSLSYIAVWIYIKAQNARTSLLMKYTFNNTLSLKTLRGPVTRTTGLLSPPQHVKEDYVRGYCISKKLLFVKTIVKPSPLENDYRDVVII